MASRPPTLDQQIAAQWFKYADENKSGFVEGGEAVSFFSRSGLPQDVLAQVGRSCSPG